MKYREIPAHDLCVSYSCVSCTNDVAREGDKCATCSIDIWKGKRPPGRGLTQAMNKSKPRGGARAHYNTAKRRQKNGGAG